MGGLKVLKVIVVKEMVVKGPVVEGTLAQSYFCVKSVWFANSKC